MTYQVQGNVVIDDSRNGYFENLPSIQKPVNISPAPGEENIAQSGFELKASAFAGVYKTHYASEWQLANASSFATNNIVINTGNIAASNVYTVSTTLAGNTLHYWRVRYHSTDSPNVSSSYSETTCFRTTAPPSVLGESYGGGFYTGAIDIGGGVCYYLIVAPNATGCACCQWKTISNVTAGTASNVNGFTNTRPPMENATHPAGNWTATRSIGGFTDWYLPAINELSTLWTNRGCLPAGEGYFTNSAYWSSTEWCPFQSYNACYVYFQNGGLGTRCKIASQRIRAVRRIPF